MDDEMMNDLVQLGTVTAVDLDSRRARVIFREKDDMPSGWLYVLQHNGAGVDITENGIPVHGQEASLAVWMPTVNQTVLVLYLPIFNGDGFILGAI